MAGSVRALWIGALAASLAVAGCARGSTATATHSPSSTRREQALLRFTQCMRDHGIDMPDPTTDSTGNLILRRPTNVQFGNVADRQRLNAASQACRSNLSGIVQQFTPQQRAAMQDRLLKYAQCMRGAGIPIPDPNFSQDNGGGILQQAPGVNTHDPKFQSADRMCRQQAFGQQAGPGVNGVFLTGPGG